MQIKSLATNSNHVSCRLQPCRRTGSKLLRSCRHGHMGATAVIRSGKKIWHRVVQKSLHGTKCNQFRDIASLVEDAFLCRCLSAAHRSERVASPPQQSPANHMALQNYTVAHEPFSCFAFFFFGELGAALDPGGSSKSPSDASMASMRAA